MRAEQKEKTRETLIETSFQVFSNQGIRTTTTLELAKIAKVAHGTIFAHFPTRENLIFEVINSFGDKLSAKFNEAAKYSKNTKAILQAHLQVLSDFEGFYIHLIEDLPSLEDKIKSRFYLLQSSISYHIYLQMQQEIQQGRVKKIERSKLFNTWIALIHYYLVNRDIFCPGKSVISTFGDELLEHFLNLIKI